MTAEAKEWREDWTLEQDEVQLSIPATYRPLTSRSTPPIGDYCGSLLTSTAIMRIGGPCTD